MGIDLGYCSVNKLLTFFEETISYLNAADIYDSAGRELVALSGHEVADRVETAEAGSAHTACHRHLILCL